MAQDKLINKGLLQVKGVDSDIIRQFHAYAVSQGVTRSALFTRMFLEFLRQQQ